MTVSIERCLRIPGETSMDEWRTILDQCSTFSFFQTPPWSDLLAQTNPSFVPYHHWIQFTDRSTALLPLFLVRKRFGFRKMESLPWGTYGGGLCASPLTGDHYQCIATRFLSLRTPVFEITCSPPCPPLFEREDGFSSNIQIKERHTHILELCESFDEIWNSSFQPRNRTAIRRARDKGVVVRWSNAENAVQSMKSLYFNAVQRWEGLETIPLSFFELLTDFPQDLVRIWQARVGEQVIASNVILYGRGKVQYLAGASDPNYNAYGGSKYLMSEIIRDACERKFVSLNFGSSGGIQGVEQFKEIFGGIQHSYYQYRFFHPWARFMRG